uniref:Heat stress transcription factor A-5 n=1 Tax=Lygus hesperus TaxID=30085 RepID=A0A0A9W888_LYGHE
MRMLDEHIGELTNFVGNLTQNRYAFLLTCLPIHARPVPPPSLSSRSTDRNTRLVLALQSSKEQRSVQPGQPGQLPQQLLATGVEQRTLRQPPFYGLSDTGPQYVNSITIITLFTVFVLLFIAVMGVKCTLAIQTPLRYATPDMLLPHTKEY